MADDDGDAFPALNATVHMHPSFLSTLILNINRSDVLNFGNIFIHRKAYWEL
jgi:hypothetical protein